MDADQQTLLARHVDSLERDDIASLVALLAACALWLRGPVEISGGFACQGSG
ncbi:MAG: hypothetical protein ACRD0K_22105 [Egibacteraceae bacterium]